MNPYRDLPPTQYWRHSAGLPLSEVDFDSGRKLIFNGTERFATAGSCFAQHFARRLKDIGGRVIEAESRHPLIQESSDHGYGVFSARYGNIYTTRQLRELFEQAVGLRDAVIEVAQRSDGRYVDLLRPRAVPMGFSSAREAEADRRFHLGAVARLMEQVEVFVFTLGLTESWEHRLGGFCYPVAPGTVAGTFDPQVHSFINIRMAAVAADLEAALSILRSVNPDVRVLLTVSPVGLVATATTRNAVVSSSYSKSALRTAAEEVSQRHAWVDYFPSYEIITSPLSRARFWADDLRDVTPAGVDLVMQHFFKSRMGVNTARTDQAANSPKPIDAMNPSAAIRTALSAECDEMFLDPALRA